MSALLFAGCRPATPASDPSARVVAEMNRGVSLMGQYLYEDAVSAFEGVLRDAPDLVDARINLAIALFNRNRQEDLAQADKLLGDVLQKEPGNLRALYFRAIVLQHGGKAQDAVPLLETVLKSKPQDGAVWYLLAICKQRVGQPSEADFLKAVECRPYLYGAYYQLYQAAMRGDQEERAQQYLEKFKTLRESPLGEALEFPQYNQMGELALAMPMAPSHVPPLARSQFQPASAVAAGSWPAASPVAPGSWATAPSGVAAGDLNGDGLADLVVTLGHPGKLAVLRQAAGGTFTDSTAGSGLEGITNALSCVIGDFNNDEQPDLGVVGAGGVRLFRGAGGAFTEVTREAGLVPASPESALFLDADHDGDLDLLVCGRVSNQLWNNNGDGTFTDIAAKAGIACENGGSTGVLAGDLDRDRDLDLVVLREGGPVRIFANELLGSYREQPSASAAMLGEAGGVLQDFNGDGLLDLVLPWGSPQRIQMWTGDGHGRFQGVDALAKVSKAVESWGALAGVRAVDMDLDGDLDLVVQGAGAHLLLNDGLGRFVFQAQLGKPGATGTVAAWEAFDVTGDLVPDLVMVEGGASQRVLVARGELVPPSTAVAVQPSGVRSRDGRTRSPASGYGVNVTVRAGLHEQQIVHTGVAGGANQSWLPVVLGLGGAGKADYVRLGWPDGVAQVETSLAAGQTHKVAELQRKISSCPVLFAWNGARFEFITDFAGVGGLGYFSAPGVSAPPQVLEHVKLEPGQLVARDGFYELRVTEPMEEAAYIDRLELLAVDHLPGVSVFPDERLAISGPPPTHALLAVDEPRFAVKALDPSGRECADRLARVDRVYAYQPVLDRRYIGFCTPHTLELDFGDRLEGLSGEPRVFLFLNGFIEYPYSQTVYAASQSRVGWEPIRVDAQGENGTWRTLVPDGGVPGGMGRMMTIDLSGHLASGTRRLRLTTNLEVYYDQVFVARVGAKDVVTVRSVPLREATLRYRGFAREYSPDGREPLIYDYELSDATAPFHSLKGAYTRYGDVAPLLSTFDDQHAIVGPGDEIALKFDASAVPLAPDSLRSFVLVSHAYCKDMDLYTATPRTLEPLPFQGMSAYPYASPERYPESEAHARYRKTYNTRWVEAR